jgi:acetamidase/formamidase
VGALPSDFAEPYVHYFRFDEARTTAEFTHGIVLPMAPFLGVVAAEPDGGDPVSAILAGSYGGNLVLRDLVVGSHLFLPVAKAGARVWIGDVHATVACVREVIHWLAAAAQVSESEAYALASMAVSFRVTQYANQTASAYSSTPLKAVHAVIPKTIFPADVRARIAAWLRPAQEEK